VNHRYPAYRFEVSREQVRRYAEATGHQSEACACGDLGQVAPPGFATCFTVAPAAAPLLEDPELGAGEHVIHSGQEYAYHRPVYVGDVLDCTPRIVQVVGRSSMDLLVLEVECVDARRGDAVVTGRGTFLFAK
jgi:acyl dehydratase